MSTSESTSMDKMLSVHQKRTNKQPKTKKKPVKVVYISNPMRVKTSASEFRALVQELTGQDAEMPDPTKFSFAESVGGGTSSSQEEEAEVSGESCSKEAEVEELKLEEVGKVRKESKHIHGEDEKDDDDDVFTQQMMMESLPGFVNSSNLWYESAHFDELKNLGIV